MKMSNKLSMYSFAMITIVLWSTGFVFTRVAVRSFTPDAIAVLRYYAASIAMLIYVLIKKIRLPRLKDIPWLLLGGATGIAIYVFAFNMGSQTVNASTSSFITSAAPVVIAILARVMLRERLTPLCWGAILLSFGGIALISLTGDGLRFDPGIYWIFLSTACTSFYSIIQRKLLLRYTPLETTAYCFFGGTILLSVFLPSAIPQLIASPAAPIWTIVYLGVFPASIGYACWAYAISKAEKTSEVTNFMYLTPVITTLMSIWMISETPSWGTVAGGVIVLAGVLLFNLFKNRKPALAAAETPAQSEQ